MSLRPLQQNPHLRNVASTNVNTKIQKQTPSQEAEIKDLLKKLDETLRINRHTGPEKVKKEIQKLKNKKIDKNGLKDTLKQYQKDNPKSFQRNASKLYVILQKLGFEIEELEKLGIVKSKLETAKLTRKGPKETERAIQRYLFDTSSSKNLKAAKEMLFAYQKKHPNNCEINRGHFQRLVQGTDLEAFVLPVKLPGTTKVGSIGTSTRSCEKAIKDFYSGEKGFVEVLTTFEMAKKDNKKDFEKREDEYRKILAHLLTNFKNVPGHAKSKCDLFVRIQKLSKGDICTQAQDFADEALVEYGEAALKEDILDLRDVYNLAKKFTTGSVKTLALQVRCFEKFTQLKLSPELEAKNKKNIDQWVVSNKEDQTSTNELKNPKQIKEEFCDQFTTDFGAQISETVSNTLLMLLESSEEYKGYKEDYVVGNSIVEFDDGVSGSLKVEIDQAVQDNTRQDVDKQKTNPTDPKLTYRLTSNEDVHIACVEQLKLEASADIEFAVTVLNESNSEGLEEKLEDKLMAVATKNPKELIKTLVTSSFKKEAIKKRLMMECGKNDETFKDIFQKAAIQKQEAAIQEQEAAIQEQVKGKQKTEAETELRKAKQELDKTRSTVLEFCAELISDQDYNETLAKKAESTLLESCKTEKDNFDYLASSLGKFDSINQKLQKALFENPIFIQKPIEEKIQFWIAQQKQTKTYDEGEFINGYQSINTTGQLDKEVKEKLIRFLKEKAELLYPAEYHEEEEYIPQGNEGGLQQGDGQAEWTDHRTYERDQWVEKMKNELNLNTQA